jgi:hypothetical protein
MTVYLKLLHGRDDPNQHMDNCGFDGPVLGPFEALHFTYTTHVRCFPKAGAGDELEVCYHDDMLVYEGKYYGDFEIAAEFGSSTPSLQTQDDLLRGLRNAHDCLSRLMHAADASEHGIDPRPALDADAIRKARDAVSKAEQLLTPPISAQAHENLVRACRLLVEAYAKGEDTEHIDWEDVDFAHDAAKLALSMVD